VLTSHPGLWKGECCSSRRRSNATVSTIEVVDRTVQETEVDMATIESATEIRPFDVRGPSRVQVTALMTRVGGAK
jgi:hypothetical protein